MNFWKKLFAGMGFVCGFLVFETMSLAYHNSRRRHKNRKGRCRRNSFWDTLMWHRQTESFAAIAERTSATPKTDGWSWSCIWANRNITSRGSCIEVAAQPQPSRNKAGIPIALANADFLTLRSFEKYAGTFS